MTEERPGGMNNDPKQTEEMCDYCFMEIVVDEPGWGYLLDEYGKAYFHSECFQIAEGVELA